MNTDMVERETYIRLTAKWREMLHSRDKWQARAEAAENDLRELRENTLLTLGLNPLDVVDGMEDVSIAYLLNGWKERIAELEALVATWRPVTAPPDKDGRYLLWWINDDDSPVFGLYSKFSDVWLYDDDDDPFDPQPTHWQPLPAPPIAPPIDPA